MWQLVTFYLIVMNNYLIQVMRLQADVDPVLILNNHLNYY